MDLVKKRIRTSILTINSSCSCFLTMKVNPLIRCDVCTSKRRRGCLPNNHSSELNKALDIVRRGLSWSIYGHPVAAREGCLNTLYVEYVLYADSHTGQRALVSSLMVQAARYRNFFPSSTSACDPQGIKSIKSILKSSY